MSICIDFHIGIEIFDKKSRNSILGSPVITSIFSCCMYKIADEIVLLSLKQASALVNKSMDPLLWRNPCWQPHVFPVQFITRISLFCRKLFYAIRPNLLNYNLLRHDTVNDHLPRNDKNLHYELELMRLPKILQLTIGSAISAWNIPISRCSIDFSWTMPSCYRSWEFRQRLFIPLKLSPRQWEIIFRLT